MGMVTLRSGSALKVTRTVTVPPSATLYEPCPKLTVTAGTSSSVMLMVVAPGAPALSAASGREPNTSCTLSLSSLSVSCVALKSKDLDVSPASKVTLSGTPE